MKMAHQNQSTITRPLASQAVDLPPGWKIGHTKFVQGLARKGEGAASIVILFETEFPDVKFGQGKKLEDVVRKIMADMP